MTIQETGIIMDILQTAYPRFYTGPEAPDRVKTLQLWAEMFAKDDVTLVAAAVKALIESDERGFPPHIGAVKAKLRLFTSPETMSEGEAWSLVANALRNSVYGAKEEFDSLPPVVQRVVHSPAQLKSWGMMDSETVQSVVASNFQRAYRTIVQREQEIAKLPADVRILLERVAAPMALEDGA